MISITTATTPIPIAPHTQMGTLEIPPPVPTGSNGLTSSFPPLRPRRRRDRGRSSSDSCADCPAAYSGPDHFSGGAAFGCATGRGGGGGDGRAAGFGGGGGAGVGLADGWLNDAPCKVNSKYCTLLCGADFYFISGNSLETRCFGAICCPLINVPATLPWSSTYTDRPSTNTDAWTS